MAKSENAMFFTTVEYFNPLYSNKPVSIDLNFQIKDHQKNPH